MSPQKDHQSASWTGDHPDWDAEFAEALVGSRVLVGITYVAANGSEELEQFAGLVTRAEPLEGVTIELEGAKAGQKRVLPPMLDTFNPASPGEYRLRETGEVVVDPDYTSVWTVHAPAENS